MPNSSRCILTLSGNGVTTLHTSESKTCGSDVYLGDYQKNFVNTGSYLAKWCPQSDGGGTCYDDKGTVTLNSDMTLYAQLGCNGGYSLQNGVCVKSESAVNGVCGSAHGTGRTSAPSTAAEKCATGTGS
ncbi:MAG: InlB B-repeat-containing protein, partial [Candidatus Peribacteria bacterium]|nr:InlB B-repeat-containing protein [Candidatus Peribacteria bacterium]